MADKHRIGAFCRREDIKFRNYGRDQGLTVMEKHLIFLHPNHQSQSRFASRKRRNLRHGHSRRVRAVGPERGRLGSVSTQLSTTLQRRSHWMNPRLAQTTSLRVMDEKKEIFKKKNGKRREKRCYIPGLNMRRAHRHMSLSCDSPSRQTRWTARAPWTIPVGPCCKAKWHGPARWASKIKAF